MTHHALIAIAVTAGILLVPVAAASGQSKIYPPGTDCANQPTIAERLLCGRQEFRRQSDTSVPQPAPLPGTDAPSVDGVPERQPLPSPTVDEAAPALLPGAYQDRTASPNQ